METYIVQSSIIQNIVESQKIYKTHIAFKNITYKCFTSLKNIFDPGDTHKLEQSFIKYEMVH